MLDDRSESEEPFVSLDKAFRMVVPGHVVDKCRQSPQEIFLIRREKFIEAWLYQAECFKEGGSSYSALKRIFPRFEKMAGCLVLARAQDREELVYLVESALADSLSFNITSLRFGLEIRK